MCRFQLILLWEVRSVEEEVHGTGKCRFLSKMFPQNVHSLYLNNSRRASLGLELKVRVVILGLLFGRSQVQSHRQHSPGLYIGNVRDDLSR